MYGGQGTLQCVCFTEVDGLLAGLVTLEGIDMNRFFCEFSLRQGLISVFIGHH